jgi:tryptophan synthase beta chain
LRYSVPIETKGVPAMSATVKYVLDETKIPTEWYNIVADLPQPPPPALHPGTLQPLGPDDLAPLFPPALIMQEVTAERHVPIPEPVREIYRQWRPAPLVRARRLEAARASAPPAATS